MNPATSTLTSTQTSTLAPAEQVAPKLHANILLRPKPLEHFECHDCNYQTFRKQAFEIHCHSKKHAVNSNPELKKLPAKRESFECAKCNYHTTRKQAFETHCQSTKHKLEHPQNGSDMILDMEVYTCTLCNYRTLQKQSMKMHLTTKKHMLRTVGGELSISNLVELKNIETEFSALRAKASAAPPLTSTESARYKELEPIISKLNGLHESSISTKKVSDVLAK